MKAEARQKKASVQPAKQVCVVEIGSTGIRLVIAEISEDKKWKVIDRAGKPVALGRDVFTNDVVSRESMLQCLQILEGFRELLVPYGIKESEAYVIATSAIREADNRDTFIDRVELQTGFKINLIEGIEENRLVYLAVQFALRNEKIAVARSNSLIMEVGGGSTEIMLLRRGRMVAAHSLRIGTIRIDQQVQAAMGSSKYLLRFLQENIRTTRETLANEMPLDRIKYFIAIGADARLAAANVGVDVDEHYSVVQRGAFERFVNQIQNYSVDELVARLHIPYADAEVLIPGLLVYKLFLEGTEAEKVIVPSVSIREGMLITIASGPDPEALVEFDRQVLASALSLGRKYHFDEAHSSHVAKLAVKLFDELTREHGLGRRERLLLEVAGTLHDIGTFIKTSGHHKHSEYIVSNSEIFGIHQDDLDIISNVVRYHRKSGPMPSHVNYVSLTRDKRIMVLKLSAILRIADALDRGHSQRVRNFNVEIREDAVILHTDDLRELSLERLSLAEKADIFEDVFGLKVVLS